MRMQTHYVYEALDKQPSNGQAITHKLHTQSQSHTYPVAHHNANQCRGYMYEFNNFAATEAPLLLVPKSTTWSLGGGFGRNVNHITAKRYNVWGMRLFIASPNPHSHCHCHSSNNNNYFGQAHTPICGHCAKIVRGKSDFGLELMIGWSWGLIFIRIIFIFDFISLLKFYSYFCGFNFIFWNLELFTKSRQYLIVV